LSLYGELVEVIDDIDMALIKSFVVVNLRHSLGSCQCEAQSGGVRRITESQRKTSAIERNGQHLAAEALPSSSAPNIWRRLDQAGL
jgi:hypothetical protein